MNVHDLLQAANNKSSDSSGIVGKLGCAHNVRFDVVTPCRLALTMLEKITITNAFTALVYRFSALASELIVSGRHSRSGAIRSTDPVDLSFASASVVY